MIRLSRTIAIVAAVLTGSAGVTRAWAMPLQAAPVRSGAAAATTTSAARMQRVAVDTEVTRLLEQLRESRKREVELSAQWMALAADSVRDESLFDRRRLVAVRLREASIDLLRAQQQLLALCDGGPRPDGWIGVSFQGRNVMYRKSDGSTTTRFVEYPSVGDVADNSPAKAAGIRRGDTVLVIGLLDARGNEISFPTLLRPGSLLPLKVKRDGELKVFSLKITQRPGDWGTECAGVDQQLAMAVRTPIAMPMPGEGPSYWRVPRAAVSPRAPRAPRATLPPGVPEPAIAPEAPEAPEAMTVTVAPGVSMPARASYEFTVISGDLFAGAELRRLSADLADLTGVEDGVFVVSVARGSPAEVAGLKGGDVIVRANDGPVVRPDQLTRAMRERDDRSVTLTVMRKGKKQVVTIKPTS